MDTRTNTNNNAPHTDNRYLQALINHYNAPLENIFKQFRLGLIAFGVGLALILIANTNIPPSLKQELTALFGLITLSVGFIIAMLAQIRLLISRILQFFWRNKA